MKICVICRKEIKPNESKRGTGTGWAHIFCIMPKKIRPETTPSLKKYK